MGSVWEVSGRKVGGSQWQQLAWNTISSFPFLPPLFLFFDLRKSHSLHGPKETLRWPEGLPRNKLKGILHSVDLLVASFP